MITVFHRTILFALFTLLQLPIHSTATDLMVNMWSVNLDHSPFPHKNAVVGDSITFKLFGPHSVWIHPSGNCADTAARYEVGARGSGLTKYVFTPEDAGKTLFFTCDSGTHCEMGQSMQVTVYGTLDKTPLDGKIIISAHDFSNAQRTIGSGALSISLVTSIIGWLLNSY